MSYGPVSLDETGPVRTSADVDACMQRGEMTQCFKCGEPVRDGQPRSDVFRPSTDGPLYLGSVHEYCPFWDRVWMAAQAMAREVRT